MCVSHNGKGFDASDVEAICDNAQQRSDSKQHAIDKTGYKGIGFKSVYVVADCVYIQSNNYSFRFDKNYPTWKNNSSQANAAQYPWPIIPIWTPKTDLPPTVLLDDSSVNFLLKLRSGMSIDAVLQRMVQNPRIMLFLRHVRTITIDMGGQKQRIKLKVQDDTSSLFIDDVLHSHWVLYQADVSVPSVVKQQLQTMGSHECPPKLKQVEKVRLSFAADTG